MVLTYLITNIITNAVNTGRDMSILYNKLTISSLILSILETFVMIFIINDDIGLHGGHISITNITQIFYIFIYIICILILQLTSFYNKEHLKITEYSLIILFAITGAIFLISTSDFVSIFLSIELQSYGLYLLSSIYKDSESSTVGSILYFLIGSMSSCVLLLGISLCYRNGGATSLENLYIITSLMDIIGE
jgi:NADH-ubiquinone oxidoreductase chain 2